MTNGQSRTTGPRFRPGLAMAALMLTVFLAAIDATVVATSMPTIVGDLGGARYYTWVTTAGMSEDDFEAFIRSSRSFSPALERVMKIMLSHRFKLRTSWMAKDIGFGLDAARDMQIPVPFSALTHEMFTIAQANGVDHYEATGVAWEAYALLAGRDKFPPTRGVPLD